MKGQLGLTEKQRKALNILDLFDFIAPWIFSEKRLKAKIAKVIQKLEEKS